jgi:hypothetical protein
MSEPNYCVLFLNEYIYIYEPLRSSNRPHSCVYFLPLICCNEVPMIFLLWLLAAQRREALLQLTLK